MTEEEATKIVLRLHGAYYSQDSYADTAELERRIAIWADKFKLFTYKVVSQAIEEWINEQKTLPHISEILPRCKDLSLLEQGSLKDPVNLKPTWVQIWDATHGEMTDEQIPQWIREMSDDMIRAMLTPPKKVDVPDMGDGLPYEI